MRLLNLSRSLGVPAEHLTTARKAAGKYPENDQVLQHLVLALSDFKEWEEAADVGRRAAELSADPVVLVSAAWSLMTVGRAQEARAAVAKVLDLPSLDPPVRTEAVFLR